MEANIESIKGLEQNLLEQGYDIKKLTLVMQWNKRDLPNISSIEDLQNLMKDLTGTWEEYSSRYIKHWQTD